MDGLRPQGKALGPWNRKLKNENTFWNSKIFGFSVFWRNYAPDSWGLSQLAVAAETVGGSERQYGTSD